MGGEAGLGGEELRFGADRRFAPRARHVASASSAAESSPEKPSGTPGSGPSAAKIRLGRIDQPDDGRGPPDAFEAGLLRRDLDASRPRRLVRAGLLLDAVTQLLQRAAAELAFPKRRARPRTG